MKRPIAISLSPNSQFTDVLMAIKMLLSPWQFFMSSHVRMLEQWFRNYFNVSFAVSFNSGRTALFAILKTLDVQAGDEVILQAFTCVVVPDAIVALGAKPVYADTTTYFTINPKDLERKITKKTKVILVQHTFCIPTDMKEIQAIARKYKLPVVEDVAHTIGGTYHGKKLGILSDMAFFSFGRDKAFSSVFGGMAITDNKDLGKKLRNIQRTMPFPRFFWVIQQLLHPVAFFLILPFYNVLGIGKILLLLLQKLHLLSFPVSSGEKKGKISPSWVRKMPNQLAGLAIHQLKRIKEFNQRREEIAQIYLHELQNSMYTFPYKNPAPLLRLPMLTENKKELLLFFKKKGVLIGDWYSNIIDPKGSDFKNVFYEFGTCLQAEKLSGEVVNLPTYPTISNSDVMRVIGILKDYDHNKRNNR